MPRKHTKHHTQTKLTNLHIIPQNHPLCFLSPKNMMREKEEEQPNNNNMTTYNRNPRKSGRRVSTFSYEPNSFFLAPKENATDDMEKSNEADDDCGRERLKRHQKEVLAAGKVKIPDKWSQEELLKDWIDSSSFDALLAPTGLSSAREALAAEGRRRRAGSTSVPGLSIESRC